MAISRCLRRSFPTSRGGEQAVCNKKYGYIPRPVVTNYVCHYSAHDHQRHVTRIPEESRAPRSDHKTLYRPSPPPPPIVDLPYMLHAFAPLANPQTARTSHCAPTLRMRSYALTCMPVLPPLLRREEPQPCTCPRSCCTSLHP